MSSTGEGCDSGPLNYKAGAPKPHTALGIHVCYIYYVYIEYSIFVSFFSWNQPSTLPWNWTYRKCKY